MRFLGPHIDLWRFMLKHKYLLLHILFLSRYLCLLNPTVLVIWSAPIMQMLINDLFTTVWLYLSDEDLVQFMCGDSGAYLLPIMNTFKSIPMSHGEEHLERQCEIFILPFGFSDSHLGLGVSLRHPGHVKYDHILQSHSTVLSGPNCGKSGGKSCS